MSMRFRNSGLRSSGDAASGENGAGANLRHLDKTPANTAVFDGRDQCLRHLREGHQAQAASAVAS